MSELTSRLLNYYTFIYHKENFLMSYEIPPILSACQANLLSIEHSLTNLSIVVQIHNGYENAECDATQ